MNRFSITWCGYMEQQSCCSLRSTIARLPHATFNGMEYLPKSEIITGWSSFSAQRTNNIVKRICSKSNLYKRNMICLCHSSSATEFRFLSFKQVRTYKKVFKIFLFWLEDIDTFLFVGPLLLQHEAPPEVSSTWQIVPVSYPESFLS